MERRFLKFIMITAILMTVGMAAYTMSAALRGDRSSGAPKVTGAIVPTSTSQAVSIDERLFPAQLAGMTRTNTIGGQEAISSVSQMHGLDITLAAAFIVSYQGNGNSQMTIWYSEAKNEQEAAQIYKAMDDKMPKSTAFKDYKTVKVDNKAYQYVFGIKQDHYYWQNGKRVIWVAIGGGDSVNILKQVAPLY